MYTLSKWYTEYVDLGEPTVIFLKKNFTENFRHYRLSIAGYRAIRIRTETIVDIIYVPTKSYTHII